LEDEQFPGGGGRGAESNGNFFDLTADLDLKLNPTPVQIVFEEYHSPLLSSCYDFFIAD